MIVKLAISFWMASSFASSLVSSSEYPDIPDKHCPPPSSFAFPKISFGSKEIVQRTWLEQWPWLYYCEGKDVLFCSVCVGALKSKKMGKS